MKHIYLADKGAPQWSFLAYRWCSDKVAFESVRLDMDFSALTTLRDQINHLHFNIWANMRC